MKSTVIRLGTAVCSEEKKKTREYYKNNTLCDCSSCLLFQQRAAELFPKQRTFLEQFGADISHPDETCPIELEDSVLFSMAGYTICGSIEGLDKDEIIELKACDPPFSVRITNGFSFPNEQEGEYFSIELVDLKILLSI